MSLDLTARRVLCLSLLYYGLDVSLVQDREFDAMCRRLHDEWDDLTPYRQWQLEPREDIRASGFHVKITERTACGAISWASMVGMAKGSNLLRTRPWHVSRHGLEAGGHLREYLWLHPADFVWESASTRTQKKGG